MPDLRHVPLARRDRSTLWTMAATLVALVASIAPWGTFGRLTVAVMFPIAVLTLVHQHGRGRRVGTVGAATLFVIVAGLHVLLTSPSVARAIDGHMLPWLPLPGATPRIILAWACTLGWTALATIAASRIRRLRTHLAAIMLLGLAGVLPLFNRDGFPVDAYELLWNRSTFTDPTYTIALLALLAATATLHLRTPTTGDHRRPPSTRQYPRPG